MADEADMANDLIASEVSSALNRLRLTTSGKMGPKNCALCEEAIPLVRRQLGFKFCIECAVETERRKLLFVD
ncbi:MAG: hypothetical protein ACD_60C00090G0004 [uncultured bacterium]|nr:MAG: hypothetical protein ACD_60C00090G0004 [uncultured bacterium]